LAATFSVSPGFSGGVLATFGGVVRRWRLTRRLAGDAVAGQPEDLDLDRLLAERGDPPLRAAAGLPISAVAIAHIVMFAVRHLTPKAPPPIPLAHGPDLQFRQARTGARTRECGCDQSKRAG